MQKSPIKIYSAKELIREAWEQIEYENEYGIPTIVDRAEEAYRKQKAKNLYKKFPP